MGHKTLTRSMTSHLSSLITGQSTNLAVHPTFWPGYAVDYLLPLDVISEAVRERLRIIE